MPFSNDMLEMTTDGGTLTQTYQLVFLDSTVQTLMGLGNTVANLSAEFNVGDNGPATAVAGVGLQFFSDTDISGGLQLNTSGHTFFSQTDAITPGAGWETVKLVRRSGTGRHRLHLVKSGLRNDSMTVGFTNFPGYVDNAVLTLETPDTVVDRAGGDSGGLASFLVCLRYNCGLLSWPCDRPLAWGRGVR